MCVQPFQEKAQQKYKFKKKYECYRISANSEKNLHAICEKLYPYGHRLIMDNCKSPTAFSTRILMLAGDINNFQSPPQSSVIYI